MVLMHPFKTLLLDCTKNWVTILLLSGHSILFLFLYEFIFFALLWNSVEYYVFIILYIMLCSLNVLINIHAIIFAVQKKKTPDVLRCT